MKVRTKFILVFSLILLATLSVASVAEAKVTKTEFNAWDIPSSLTPGKTWMEDGYLYMRKFEGTSQVFQVAPADDLQITGSADMNLNANIDLALGCGHVWGKFVLTIHENAYWSGSYTGELCVDASGSPQSFSTHGVAQGGGELKGKQMRYTNVNGYMTGVILDTPSQ